MHAPLIGKLKPPLSRDQVKGAAKSDPIDFIKIDNRLHSHSSHEVLAQTKIDIIKQAVANCHQGEH